MKKDKTDKKAAKALRYLELKEEIERSTAELDALKGDLIGYAENGDGNQVNLGVALVKLTETARRTPKWKDEAVKLAVEAGQDARVYEATIQASAPVSISRKLEVIRL